MCGEVTCNGGGLSLPAGVVCSPACAATSGASGVRLMMTPTNYSPEDSLADDLPSDDEELPRLKLIVSDEISSSRSPSP